MKNKKGPVLVGAIFVFALAASLFVATAPMPVIADNQTNCTDTDGGLNYEIQGTTYNATASHTDYCIYEDTVLEGFCSNGRVLTQQKDCLAYYGTYCSNITGGCVL